MPYMAVAITVLLLLSLSGSDHFLRSVIASEAKQSPFPTQSLRGSEATEAIAFNVFFFAFILSLSANQSKLLYHVIASKAKQSPFPTQSLRGSKATEAISVLTFLSLRGHAFVIYGRGNRISVLSFYY